MRATSSELATHILYDVQQAYERLSNTQRKLSTGKAVSQVEDDPVAAGRAMFLRGQVSDLNQYQTNVGEALGWLNASDSAIGSVQDVMKRAKTLLVQAANGTVDQKGLDAIATEINKLIDGARGDMNASFAGRYLFGGTQTLAPPYPGAALAYAGDANQMQRVIGESQSVPLNLVGFQAFSVPNTAGGQNVLQLLDQLKTDLQAGNRAALGNADMTATDAMLDQLSGARAEVGSRVNRLTTEDSRLKDLTLNVQSLLSKTEDADMAKTMIDYSTQQATYQSALQSGARVVQPSLLDFLH
jgi:flagellar hook-associated protein 3 FlgL